MAAHHIQIKHEINKCVGNKNCLMYAPKYFSFSKKKAHLKKNYLQDEVQFLDCAVDDKELQALVQAAKSCPVNVIAITDAETKKEIIGNTVKSEVSLEIEAEQFATNDLQLDKKGYFLIKINKENKTIEVGFCKKRNIIAVKITGKNPLDIYKTIAAHKLISRQDHAAYLGYELQKAYIALKKNLDYIQDSELEL